MFSVWLVFRTGGRFDWCRDPCCPNRVSAMVKISQTCNQTCYHGHKHRWAIMWHEPSHKNESALVLVRCTQEDQEGWHHSDPPRPCFWYTYGPICSREVCVLAIEDNDCNNFKQPWLQLYSREWTFSYWPCLYSFAFSETSYITCKLAAAQGFL